MTRLLAPARLADLDPSFVSRTRGYVASMAEADGVTFRCPGCIPDRHNVLVWFDDEGCLDCHNQIIRPATGNSLETLTLLGEPVFRRGDCSDHLTVIDGIVTVLP